MISRASNSESFPVSWRSSVHRGPTRSAVTARRRRLARPSLSGPRLMVDSRSETFTARCLSNEFPSVWVAFGQAPHFLGAHASGRRAECSDASALGCGSGCGRARSGVRDSWPSTLSTSAARRLRRAVGEALFQVDARPGADNRRASGRSNAGSAPPSRGRTDPATWRR